MSAKFCKNMVIEGRIPYNWRFVLNGVPHRVRGTQRPRQEGVSGTVVDSARNNKASQLDLKEIVVNG